MFSFCFGKTNVKKHREQPKPMTLYDANAIVGRHRNLNRELYESTYCSEERGIVIERELTELKKSGKYQAALDLLVNHEQAEDRKKASHDESAHANVRRTSRVFQPVMFKYVRDVVTPSISDMSSLSTTPDSTPINSEGSVSVDDQPNDEVADFLTKLNR